MHFWKTRSACRSHFWKLDRLVDRHVGGETAKKRKCQQHWTCERRPAVRSERGTDEKGPDHELRPHPPRECSAVHHTQARQHAEAGDKDKKSTESVQRGDQSARGIGRPRSAVSGMQGHSSQRSDQQQNPDDVEGVVELVREHEGSGRETLEDELQAGRPVVLSPVIPLRSYTMHEPDNDWRAIIARYQQPDTRRAISELAITLGLLVLTLGASFAALSVSVILTFVLLFPAAGLLIRTFIIMHDCAHGSFLPSRRWTEVVGFITGVLTFTPFSRWRRDHSLHHASAGDLDRRGHGDVATLTVREYKALPRGARFRYRLFRHPAVLLLLGPLQLMIGQRIPPRGAATRQQITSVWTTNAAIAVLVGVLFALDPKLLLLVYLPALYLAGMAGVTLFYLQHQFEGTYWEEHANWDYATAAVRGSSYLRLPGVLQWFTGSIGLHHVHHLGPRIPHYNLQRCHDENEFLHEATVVTPAQTIRAMRLALWDEEQKQLVSFAGLETARGSDSRPAEAIGNLLPR